MIPPLFFCLLQFEPKINQAVFPALQGGPHNHQIAALATQLIEVKSEEFKQYARQVQFLFFMIVFSFFFFFCLQLNHL